ncbi:hypothetical protein [Leptospira bourretii]|nr:hypothetical protein [Leptospira bourretii]
MNFDLYMEFTGILLDNLELKMVIREAIYFAIQLFLELAAGGF